MARVCAQIRLAPMTVTDIWYSLAIYLVSLIILIILTKVVK